MNEWIDLDGIVLARLIGDVKAGAFKERAALNRDVSAGGGSGKGEEYRGVHARSRNHQHIPTVHFQDVDESTVSGRSKSHTHRPSNKATPNFLSNANASASAFDDTDSELSLQDEIDAKTQAHVGIRELHERIKGMKAWRKELERSVVWQREECWRVQGAMGKQRDGGGDRGREGESGLDGQDEQGGNMGKSGVAEVEEGKWGVGGRTWERGR